MKEDFYMDVLGLRMADVRAVVLSHGHADHASRVHMTVLCTLG